MEKKLYIDASHPDETRVVLKSDNGIEEYEYEDKNKLNFKNNIYLGTVSRVEPSLQAAFINFGRLKHGFLAFNDIQSDYYQIPTEDKERLQEAEEKINRIIVSHKPDHGIQGKLHEDTAYGIIEHLNEWEKANGYNVVRRKPVADLSRKEILAIRDPNLREKFVNFSETFESEQELKLALPEFAKNLGVLRVRVLKKENPIITIEHPRKFPVHKKGLAPGSIHHLEFWRLPNGIIQGVGVNFFETHKNDLILKRPHPAAKLVMKMHKGDILRLQHKGQLKIARVVSLSPGNSTIWLVEHFESGNLSKRYKEKTLEYIFLSFSKLKECEVRKIHVDTLGRIKDPGAIL